MRGPAKPNPSDVEAVIARLRRGADNYRDIYWPGANLPIRIRVLTRSERQYAFAAARRRFESALGIQTVDLDTREEFAAEQINQVLAVAILDPGKRIAGTAYLCEPMFADGDDCRDSMNDAEQAALWDHYLALEQDTDPTIGGGITVEMIELVAEAQKKRAPALLKVLAPYSLRTLLAITDAERSTFLIGKSGFTASPETDLPNEEIVPPTTPT